MSADEARRIKAEIATNKRDLAAASEQRAEVAKLFEKREIQLGNIAAEVINEQFFSTAIFIPMILFSSYFYLVCQTRSGTECRFDGHGYDCWPRCGSQGIFKLYFYNHKKCCLKTILAFRML